jgi:NAD(P)-dependent dehydrogenase (short-subunit alcohol dehydrogenase family)
MKTTKTILITGATAGIGRHAALHFAKLGHHVIATGRGAAALAELSKSAVGKLDTVRLDVTDAASIAAAVVDVDRLTGDHGVDVLINNAGYGLAAPLEEVSETDLRAQFETNVFGLMAVTRAFLPRMRARGAGRIINVSSVGGRVTFPMFGAYHASKYAVEALSDAFRLELAPFGIQVSLIEPGPIRSEFNARSMAIIDRYKSDSSPYAGVYARANEISAQADKMAAGPEATSKAMERAITSRRPYARYVVPFTSRLTLWFLSSLPTGLRDWVMRAFVGHTKKSVQKLAARPVAATSTQATSAAA